MSKLTVEQIEEYRPHPVAGKDCTIGVPAPIMRQFCDTALASVRDAEPKGWQLVPVELTAENGAKAALMGEFNFRFGDDTPNVPWTTIKEIHRAVVKLFASSHPTAHPSADELLREIAEHLEARNDDTGLDVIRQKLQARLARSAT